jgi:hypothetical protein
MQDGAALERAAVVGADARVQTDTTKPVALGLHARPQTIANGGANWTLEGDLTLRVLPQLDFDLMPSFTSNVGEPRHVGAGPIAGE